MHSRGFRTSDPQRNAMGQSTEMSPLVSMLFRTFLNCLKFLMNIFNILVLYTKYHSNAHQLRVVLLHAVLLYYNNSKLKYVACERYLTACACVLTY